MTVTRRVHNTTGGWHWVPVSGTPGFYAGDGHDHWHVYKLQSFEIRKLNADGRCVPDPTIPDGLSPTNRAGQLSTTCPASTGIGGSTSLRSAAAGSSLLSSIFD
jgi:hypothetical protein